MSNGCARVRAARSGDEGAVLGLWRAAGFDDYTADASGDFRRTVAHDADLVLVADGARGPVGTVTATFDGRRGWLMRLAVDPGCRRQGIGEALVHEAERRLAARGAPQVNLLVFRANADAQVFWERLGYLEAGHAITLRHRSLNGVASSAC